MASNMYLKFEDPAGTHSLKADCDADGHKEEIEVLSWSHGFSQPTSPIRSSAGSGTVEQANHSDWTFSKYMDTSTKDLVKFCWTGNQVAKAIFSCYRADGTDAAPSSAVPYLIIEFEEVVISNYSVGGGPGDIPVETISLNYGTVKYIYKPQKNEDGTGADKVETKHDLKTRKVS